MLYNGIIMKSLGINKNKIMEKETIVDDIEGWKT
jgi:hypothetical protein